MCKDIKLRKFDSNDISKKVEWVNAPYNNKFLHYDLPLEYEKTLLWYEKTKNLNNRYDAVVLYNDIPVGLIGLLNIDNKNKKAEYYVLLGEKNYKGLGIATNSTKLLLKYAFNELELNKIYLYTEEENIVAQKLFEKTGFIKEGFLKNDLFHNNKYVNRYLYGICKGEFCNE